MAAPAVDSVRAGQRVDYAARRRAEVTLDLMSWKTDQAQRAADNEPGPNASCCSPKKGLPMHTNKGQRTERLQVNLSKNEVVAIDEFRFENRMPTRAAAVREILRRALIVCEKEEPPPWH